MKWVVVTLITLLGVTQVDCTCRKGVYPDCVGNYTRGSQKMALCYDQRANGTRIVTLSGFNIGGYQAGEWSDYVWFLGHPTMGWGGVIAQTGGWTDTSYGWESIAGSWKGKVSLTQSRGVITISIQGQVPVCRGMIQEGREYAGRSAKGPWCHQLELGVYKGRGFLQQAHPRVYIGLCPYSPPNTTQPVETIAKSPHSEAKVVVISHPPPRTVDGQIKVATGVSGTGNNWLLLAERAANTTTSSCIVCMGPRPLLRIVPAAVNVSCVTELMTNDNLNPSCSEYDLAFPLAKTPGPHPIFSVRVAPGNFICVNLSRPLGTPAMYNVTYCADILILPNTTKFVPRADLWWWCGGPRLFDKPPVNPKRGLCALISLIIPASLFEVRDGHWPDPETALHLQSQFLQRFSRIKRAVQPKYEWLGKGDPTYIDAIGVPRGVPDEYKIADQIAGGFESSLCPWCTINKNVDRVNYVHYNVQKLGNWTQEGFEAVHEQLRASSLMAFQNRIALDMLLSEKGGVCAIFGDQCCTFIPNNTAPDGRLTRAIDGLRTLNRKMKEHSGVDTSMWDKWMDVFGKYKSLVSSVLLSIAVFAALLTLCGCCCIPCLRELSQRLITRAVGPQDQHHMLPLLVEGEAAVDREESVELQCRDY